MTVTYTSTVKYARMVATQGYFTNGSVVITTPSGLALATWTIGSSAGAVSSDVWTLNFSSTNITASNTGTAYYGVLNSSDGTENISGLLVSTTGSDDITIDNTSINSGQGVTMTSASITHAA